MSVACGITQVILDVLELVSAPLSELSTFVILKAKKWENMLIWV
jgi:hypothetical protein